MPCPRGYYKSGSGNYKCSKCPLGTIQPGTGHTACQVRMPRRCAAAAHWKLCVVRSQAQRQDWCHAAIRSLMHSQARPSQRQDVTGLISGHVDDILCHLRRRVP